MIEKWDAFLEVLNVFKIPYEITNALQNPKFTLSDFYSCWLKIEHKLGSQIRKQHLLTDFAVLLREKLGFRKQELLKNAAMMCAVYLDPRVRLDLSFDEINIAKMTLEKLFKKVQNIKAQNKPIDYQNFTVDIAAGYENGPEDSFEKYMASKAAAATTRTSGMEVNNEIDFFGLLTKFEVATPFHNEPVLPFWESQKDSFPELYELASIINSIPPTQATVERSFSMLNFIYTCRRNRLGQKILQDILTIKLNADIARQINECDIQQIELQNKDRETRVK